MGFFLKAYGRRALEPARNFFKTMGELYAWAGEVYAKNLSTTNRPFYIKTPRFFLIHATDPHLMCIPSLHVMVVIRTYTLFRKIAKDLHEEERFAGQLEELRSGALAITEAVLYVKQHSVNCIPAAMYAMTRFDSGLFSSDEAERFVSDLFREGKVSSKDGDEIREYILSLYRRFMTQGESSADWTGPLLSFLEGQPHFY
jgi:hypothetical protein